MIISCCCCFFGGESDVCNWIAALQTFLTTPPSWEMMTGPYIYIYIYIYSKCRPNSSRPVRLFAGQTGRGVFSGGTYTGYKNWTKIIFLHMSNVYNPFILSYIIFLDKTWYFMTHSMIKSPSPLYPQLYIQPGKP